MKNLGNTGEVSSHSIGLLLRRLWNRERVHFFDERIDEKANANDQQQLSKRLYTPALW